MGSRHLWDLYVCPGEEVNTLNYIRLLLPKKPDNNLEELFNKYFLKVQDKTNQQFILLFQHLMSTYDISGTNEY